MTPAEVDAYQARVRELAAQRHQTGFVVAGPVGYLGRGKGCYLDHHNCPLGEAYVYSSEAAAVSAQRLATAAGGVGLTVHEVDVAWLRSKQAAS